MSENITITINKRLVAILSIVTLLHLGFLVSRHPIAQPSFDEVANQHQLPMFKLQPVPKIRTIGKKDGSKRNSVLVTPKDTAKVASQAMDPFKAAAAMNNPAMKKSPPAKRLAQPDPTRQASAKRSENGALPYRPATRPSALAQLTRGSQSVADAAASVRPGGQASAVNSPLLSKSQVNMQVEVPEGVAEGELNEYELKFYGFQKRMMEKYISAIMLQVRDFERRHPHKALVPEGKHVMTGRVTFDPQGNIKRIKMVRWSKADGLQEMFDEVLKAMDSVPNPPKLLWDKQGEFTVFYNLTVNNG